MGKAAMCIKMLQILNTGRVYRISELAEMLETNPRNVIEYKKELDEVGYVINSIPGRYGGYQLEKSNIIPSLRMLPNEKAALVDAFNYTISKSDFINKNGYMTTMGKIFSSLLIEHNKEGYIVVNKINSNIEESLIEKNYNIISKAIANKVALKMTYKWLKEPISTIVVHPYKLFLYDNEWRFFGWNVNVGEVFYFKLTRVANVEILNEKFRVWKYFKAEDYLKKNVFSPNGEMFKVVLIAYGVRAKLIKEKQFGYNQVYEDLPNGSVKVTMEMQKNPSTYNTILGFGDLVEIIEPDWLKEKIKNIAMTIYSKYK